MNTRLVFLFGAGASFGTTHVTPCGPPLMRDLFDRLAHDFPNEWGPTSKRWPHCEGLRAHFEETLTELLWPPPPGRNDPLDMALSQWTIAQYFGKFQIEAGGEDCYSRLLSALGARAADVVFASLNFDCLFEQAALEQGLHSEYGLRSHMLPTPRAGYIRVVKPHGSCNFVAEIARDSLPMLTMGRVEPSQIRTLSPFGLAACLADLRDTGFPIICQLSHRKEAIVALAAISRLQRHWKVAASEADVLAIIGVSHNPHDWHVNSAVEKARAVLYVGSPDEAAKWRAVNRSVDHIGETFADGLPELLRCVGLGASGAHEWCNRRSSLA